MTQCALQTTSIPLDHFSVIVAAQRNGHTCLPNQLGLNQDEFTTMIAQDVRLQQIARIPATAVARSKGELRQQLLDLRRDEWQDLRNLLLDHRRPHHPTAHWMASIIAAACLGSEHLWRDLGLQSRLHLRQLLSEHFPALVERNDRDMRWKKFFYKQLCEQEGGYVCRSPTCEACPTYHECFGDES